jgi:hypothetical protein
LLCVGSVAAAASGARPRTGASGTALLILGVAWSLTALGEVSPSVPYTIGRAATWFTLPSVFYRLLAIPAGRLVAGLHRALFYAIVADVVS